MENEQAIAKKEQTQGVENGDVIRVSVTIPDRLEVSRQNSAALRGCDQHKKTGWSRIVARNPNTSKQKTSGRHDSKLLGQVLNGAKCL